MSTTKRKNGQKLTHRQKRFVEEFCIDFNQAAAARRAGYSEKYAKEIGFQNSTKLHVKKAIRKRLDELAMSAGEALVRLSKMGRASLEPFLVDDENGLKRIDLSTEDASYNLDMIKELEVTSKVLHSEDDVQANETKVKIKVHDAKDALIKILQIHGMFVENVKQLNINVDYASLTDDQIKRIANGEDPEIVVGSTPTS